MANLPQSPPEKEFTTEANNKVVMTYGLFSDVMRIIGNTNEAVDILMTDPSVRDFVIRRLFTDLRKPIDNLDDLINPYDIDLSPLELDELIAWVADHLMHFTMSTAEKTRPVVEKYANRAASLSQLRTGSET